MDFNEMSEKLQEIKDALYVDNNLVDLYINLGLN